jgi:methionyl-tRNA synthetase
MTHEPDVLSVHVVDKVISPYLLPDFNESKLLRLVNAELADTLGNLLSRCSAEAINPAQIWPKFNREGFDTLSSRHGEALMQAVEALTGMSFSLLY